jgi:tetratricopeptide (TPR) repeat protein
VKAYAKLTAGSDRTKLSAESLRELVGLLGEAGLPAEAAAAGEEYLRRFPTAPLGEAAAVRKLVGDAALKAGKPEDAAKHLRAALVPELALADRLDALASLVRAVGVERKNPDEVESLRKLLDAAVQGQRLGEPERKAYQRGLVAVGDAALWHGDPDAAREPYRQAERQRDLLAGQAFPANVRAARVGAFANSMREYLDARDYRAAADLVDGLEASFPTEKANGDTFFWRGKLLSLTGDAGAAARYLARAVTLAPGAKTEPEARWLLAAALEKLGKADAAREELRRLAGLGGNDSFVKQAREKLKP